MKLDTTSRVIIIGNSPSILLHKYGEQIDSYDVVIRINRCVTKGFEKYIGKKIDIWATTHGSERFKKMDDFVPENYSEIKCLWKRTTKVSPKLPKDFPEVEEHIMYKAPSGFKKYYAAFFNDFEIEHEPDTGLLTILTSLQFYKDITVHGFTFYTEHKKHFVEGYYRESELDEEWKHPEDEYWSGKSNLEFSDPQTSAFASEANGRKKRKLLNELITNGFPFKPTFVGDENEGISTEPIKILNEDELGKMNIERKLNESFNEEDGISYTEFFAYHKTTGGDIDNLRDSDDCSRLLKSYNASNPPDGWFRRYWENGNLRYEWYFKDGKPDGVSKSWWPNGDIKSEWNYKNGKLHGKRTAWYENGSPRVIHDGQVAGIRYYNNGSKDGLWTDYYKSGQVWMKKTYESGNLISEEYWNADGSVGTKDCHNRGEFKQFRKINPDY